MLTAAYLLQTYGIPFLIVIGGIILLLAWIAACESQRIWDEHDNND